MPRKTGAGPGGSALPIPPRFNEAAARCRGKPATDSAAVRAALPLQ